MYNLKAFKKFTVVILLILILFLQLGDITYAKFNNEAAFNELSQRSVNVKWYGAKGNGTTDDTRAIQKAIDSLSKGGIVFFPTGTYYITQTIIVKNYVILEGVNSYSYDLQNLVASTIVTDKPITAIQMNGMTRLRDIQIRGKSTTNGGILASSLGVKMGYDTNREDAQILENSRIEGFELGVEMRNTTCSIINSVIQTCNVGVRITQSPTVDPVEGVLYTNSRDKFIRGSTFHNWKTSAIEIDNVSHNVSISDNRIDAVGIFERTSLSLPTYGIRIIGSNPWEKDKSPFSINITGNHFWRIPGSAVSIENSSNIVVSGNSFNEIGKAQPLVWKNDGAVLLENSHSNTITGNNFRFSHNAGIYNKITDSIKYLKYVNTITGNSFYNCNSEDNTGEAIIWDTEGVSNTSVIIPGGILSSNSFLYTYDSKKNVLGFRRNGSQKISLIGGFNQIAGNYTYLNDPNVIQGMSLFGLASMADQPDSTANDIATLRNDFNRLLKKMRDANLLE